MRLLALSAIALFAVGCHDKVAASSPDMALPAAFAAHDKVDILFVSGNEDSTTQYRQELQKRIPELIKALGDAAAEHPASYHFGIITPNLGAGSNTRACASSDGARLYIGPGQPTSLPPPAYCSNLALSGNARYVEWDAASNSGNFSGVSDVSDAFDCLVAFVPSGGCGFQQPLEASYLALHGDVPENAGFLRDDALLVVVYVVDEDDCSVPDDDLFDSSAAAAAAYGPLSSFRCVQFGVSCGSPAGPLPTGIESGPRNDCVPLKQADGGKLIDLDKYIDFLSRPGGVKADPSDVIVAAISSPPTPFGVSLIAPCPGDPSLASCQTDKHSCIAATNPIFFGNPTVRVSTVVASAATTQTSSICDADFSPPLADLAQKILARLK